MNIWNDIKNWYCGKFNYKKYWEARHKLENPGTLSPLSRIRYTLYYEKMNVRYNADIMLGWDETTGKRKENFITPPNIPEHGINGIIISGGARIGKNVTICHQVTIGKSRGKAPVIGDNVFIGPGAKIFGGIHVGNNVKIGANCVVFEDIPDNATVVLSHPRIIEHQDSSFYYTDKKIEFSSKIWGTDGRIQEL